MHIAIVSNTTIPALKYGGTERVIWWLGKQLVNKGHKVTYLVNKGSYCPFAEVVFIDESRRLHEQIPAGADLVHYNTVFDDQTPIPWLITEHGNGHAGHIFPRNTVFVSDNHARRMGATAYVHNGLGTDDYDVPDLARQRHYVHFLGHAGWKIKNAKGAIRIAKMAGERIAVLGGHRLNLNMGIKFSPALHARFYGKVGGSKKNQLINGSKALVFPVLWNEPFGIAIIESLLYGCPVFGTPFGSLPELVIPEVGGLSDSYQTLAAMVQQAADYDRKRCHEYVCDVFSAKVMAEKYLQYYTQVLNGMPLNENHPIAPAEQIPFAMRP